jgi:Ca2+-binding EF-hand superfamily protein
MSISKAESIPNVFLSPIKELKNALTALNMQDKNGTFYQAVALIEKDGPIDFSKFLEIMTARTGLQRTRNNIKKQFANLDSEKNGFIAPKNLKKIVKDIGLTLLTDDEINEMIEKADLNNDGLVSEE